MSNGSDELYAPKRVITDDLLVNIDKCKLSVRGRDTANDSEIYLFKE